MKDHGWYSAQVPNFVKAPAPSLIGYVEPAVKAREAEKLRAEVDAFIAAGGDFERLPSPDAWAKDREA